MSLIKKIITCLPLAISILLMGLSILNPINLSAQSGPALPNLPTPGSGGSNGGGTTIPSTGSTGGIKTPSINEICNGATCPGGITQSNASSLAGENGVLNLLLGVANFITFIAGGIAVIAMVIGGIYYITANGDSEKATKGKDILVNASIGLAVTIVAYTIVFLITAALGNTSGGGFFSNFF